jgi:hypothetical protein
MVTREQLLQRAKVREKILQYLMSMGDVRFNDLSVSDATLDDCRDLMRLGYVIVEKGSNPKISLTPEGRKQSGMKVWRRKPKGR